MLTTREDYKTLYIPYDIQINGNVMPDRYTESNALYGEDICWLAERMNRYISGSNQYYAQQKISSIDKRIIGARYQWIIDWMIYTANSDKSISGKFISPNAQWDTFYEFDGFGSNFVDWPCGLNKDAELKSSVFEANKDDFATGKPLKREPILTLYNDFTKWESVQSYNWLSGTGDYTFEVENHDPNGYVSSRKKPGASHTFYFYAADGGTSYKSGSTWKWRADWGYKFWRMADSPTRDAEYQIPFDRRQFLADTATIFLCFDATCCFHTTAMDDNGYQDWDRKTWVYVFPVTCEKSDWGYTVSYSSIQNCTNQIIARRGWNNPNPGGYSQNGTSGVWQADIVISSSNWSILKLNNDMDYNKQQQ